MGIFGTLGRLRNYYLAGRISDHEYDELRIAAFKGETIEQRLDEIERQKTPKQGG